MEAQGVGVDWTEDVTVLAQLSLSDYSRYRAVIFLSTSRDTLWKHGTAVDPAQAVNTRTQAHLDAAKTALRQFIRSGGGFVGIHNAFGTEYNWHWYEGLLGDANYFDHGANQDGSRQDRRHRIRPRRGSATSPFKTSGTTLSRSRLASNSSPLSTRTRWPREEQCTRGTETSIPSLGASTTTVAVRGLRRSATPPTAFTDGSGFPGQQQFKSLIVNGILSAMGNIPFCQ